VTLKAIYPFMRLPCTFNVDPLTCKPLPTAGLVLPAFHSRQDRLSVLYSAAEMLRGRRERPRRPLLMRRYATFLSEV
jgi:hypothetical protein